MSNKDFGAVAVCVFLTIIGIILLTKPRLIPRFTNAYYALIRMKSRLVEEDYDKRGVRFAGAVFILFAIYVFFSRFSHRF